MVDDDIPERADRVVEVPAILDAEGLGHGDLHAGDVVAIPDRLEHGVREPQVQDLLEAHLAQEVVDPVDLGFVDVGVEVGRERLGRLQVVAERLLDHDALAGADQAGLGRKLRRSPLRTTMAGLRDRTPGTSARPTPA